MSLSTSREDALKVLYDYLLGVPMAGAGSQGAVHVRLDGAEPGPVQEHDWIFSPTDARPDAGRWIELDGALGEDGDEAVLDNAVVVETIGFAAADFTPISGPSYLSLRGEEDQEAFTEAAREFERTGVLPAALRSGSIVLELSNYLGPRSPEVSLSRTFRGEDGEWGENPSLISGPGDESQRRLALACVLLRRVGQADELTVSVPQDAQQAPGDALIARVGSQKLMLRGEDLRIFSLSDDAYRVMDLKARLVDDARVASELGVTEDDVGRAVRRIREAAA